MWRVQKCASGNDEPHADSVCVPVNQTNQSVHVGYHGGRTEGVNMIDGRIDLKKICALLLIATAIALAVHLVSLDLFNKRENVVHGNDATSVSYMEIDARKDSTSTWVKRDYDLFGEKVNITGATIDGELHNTSSDTISNWTLRLNIQGDCLINQAWNGEVEIHQYVGTADETVQRMNLQNYNLDDVKLDHLYDGDLLIPLKAGDYVIYYPSEKFKEMPLAGNDSIKIGVIFYYLNALDLSDYDLTFQYHRAFYQGPTFLVFVLLAVLSFVFVLMYIVSDVTYKRAQNELELRKSGLSWLSGMYIAVYLMDLTTGDMTPISVGERGERERPWDAGAKSYLDRIVADSEEPYRDLVAEFTDITTLPRRMADRGSVLCEFESKTFGWSKMRFFAMDFVKGQKPERAICTVQDINEEKRELDRVEKRVKRAESEGKAKYALLADISQEVRAPLSEIVGLGERIAAESDDEAIRAYARELCGSGDELLMFVDEILDYSGLEAGRIRLSPVDYSLKTVIKETSEQARMMLEKRGLSFDLDVSPSLPSWLSGDSLRLKQVVCEIVISASDAIESGNVRLSVFGKVSDGKAHMLISVRATESGDGEGSAARGLSGQSAFDDGAGARMSLVSGLLELMGSELKVVQSNDDWHECYFEIDQDVVDVTPVGEFSA